MPFRIDYAPGTEEHLRYLTSAQQSLAQDHILEQLTQDHTVETRNRKPLRPNDLATWELRIGSIRVYYDVAMRPDPVVAVVAIGIKTRSILRIGGEVITL